MNNLYIILTLLLFISCKSQKTEAEEKAKVEVSPPQLKPPVSAPPPQNERNFWDFDPYHTKEDSIISVSGPQSITRNILQDKKGNYWFATWQGIIGYDGKVFTNYTYNENLKKNRVFSLLEDNAGNIWFGTIGAGVYKYDGQKFKHFSMQDGLINNEIGCIYQDSEGQIWFGTREGISILNDEKIVNYSSKDGLCDNDVNGILEYKKGEFWIATRGWSCTFDVNEFKEIRNQENQPFTNVRSIIKDSRGLLWLGGNDGLWSYDGEIFRQYTTNFIGNIYEDSKQNIWVSKMPAFDYKMELHRFDVEIVDKIQKAGPVPSNEVSSTLIVDGFGQVFGIFEDNKGDIWFGLEYGLGRYDGEHFEYFRAKKE